jgi:hypothetical protein
VISRLGDGKIANLLLQCIAVDSAIACVPAGRHCCCYMSFMLLLPNCFLLLAGVPPVAVAPTMMLTSPHLLATQLMIAAAAEDVSVICPHSY